MNGCGKISPPTGFDPRTIQPVASRYTDCAIAGHANIRTKPKITNTELANHRCRIPTNIITAVMRIKLPNKISGHLGVPKNVLGIPGLFKKRYSPRGKSGTNGASTLVGNDSVYVDGFTFLCKSSNFYRTIRGHAM